MRVFERAALLPLLAVLSLVAPATVLGGDDVPPEVTAKSASGLLPVAIDLGRARRFNGFFLEHFSAPSSDTEGALAAGGDVALDSYSVGERLHAGFTGPSLIAGGDLVFPSGRVYRGDIVVGGSAAGVGAPVIEGLGADQSLAEYAELPFDFALQGIRLRATSQHLATLTANGSFEWQWGGLHLQGDCESAWQVFELNGAQVLEAHTFEVDCIPAGATVIFNIDGSEAGLTNMSLESLAAHRQRVLFNFHQAQTLTLAGIAVQGSILAPHAHVANPQGVVHGSVMAKSWHGSMQLNHVPFRAVGEGDICGLYPIALPHELLIDAEPGTVFEQMPRGTGPGNFNWLTWTGHPSAPTLAQSLIPPGDSHTYINPDDPDDFLLSVGDWAQGSPGTVNSAAVRANLDALLNTEIAVPAFDARRNQGNNFDYRVASFARIRLIDYRLTGQGWLSFEFVGFTRCYNRAPIAHDQQLETPRDTPLPIELTGTDYDGDELSFEILTQPAHGSLEGEGAHWTYTPAPGYVGPDQFTFRVSDGEADSAPVTVSITVFQTNQPPIAHDQQLEVLQGESLDIELTGEDPDGDPLSFRIIEAPQHGSLNGESPSLVYTPNPDFHGEDSFSFVAHDGEIDSEPAVVRIRVLRVNLPPQIISQAPFTVEEDALYRYPAEAVDPNVGDVLTWSLDARPVGMEVGAASGVAEWVGDASLVGGVELQNRMCRRGRLPGVFDPEVKWHWKREPGGGTDRNVYGPVTVAQMNDDNGDGVIDHRDIPDAVFMSSGGLLNIVSGADGSQILASSGHGLSTLGSLALADLTGDGYVEIVGVSSAQRTELIAVRHDGTELWRVPTSGPTVTGSNGIPRDALTIADLDGDGTPEIIHGRRVYNADGSLRWVGTGDHGGNRGYALIPSVADVTGDGFQEVIAGRTVYRHDGTILWHVPTTADGYTGVANFDDDPYPEIVLVAGGRVHLIDHDGTLLWRSGTLPGGGHGGPPTIADMDGDGIPEIGVAGSSRYVVFNADGSIKWSMPVQDHSSHQTGSSVFDFEGDGRAEVVYADEVHLFVFDGATGAVRLKMPIGSGTTLEYPTIVDIDGNGSANILVGGNAVNGRRGVFAIGSATDSWAPTRKIWNQHAYHIDNINDDGSVPLHPTKGWLTHNSFRLNTFPDREALALPDLALFDLRLASAEHGPVLRVRVRNRGLAPVEEDTEVVFHSGNLSGPWNLVGRVAVPPLSADVAIEIDLPLDSVTGLGDYLRAEIDPEGLVGECIEANNITFARLAQIRVTDPGGLFDTQIFSIAVSDRNDPPTLHTESLPHGAPESAWQAQLYATDPDIGDALQYGLVAAPEGMHIDEVSGQLVWTPLASQSGDHLVTVQVSDLAGAVVERSYQVRIADNHPPEFVSEPVTVAEVGQPYSYAAYAIDPEGDPVSYSLVTAPTGMSVDDTTGVVSWMPQLAQIGVHTVALRAEDRLGAGTTQQFEIDVVGPLNRPPVITSTPSTTAFAGQLYQYLVEAEDPDGDVLSVLLPEAPAGMVLNEFSGLLSWVPEEGQVGTHAVRVEVIDGRGGVAVQTWDLVVQAPDPDNQPPSIDSTPGFTATVGLEYIYQVVASDPDGDALSYSLIDGPAGMSMDAVSGRLNFTPSLAQVGTHAVAVRVDDGRGGYAVQNYTLTVLDGSGGTNHPPSIVSTPPGSVVLGSSYTYQVEAVDPDGDSLIHVLRQAPAGMSLGHASGLLTWTPLPEQVGQHDVVLEVSDGRGGVASQSFVVQVQDDGGGGTNRPPTIVSQPPTQAKVGREYRYAVDAFDADGDALNYSVPAGPDGMSVDADGVLTWTPADAGSVAASVRVDDGQAWVQQHWTIQVAAADVELGADVLISPQPVAPGESLVITIIVEGAAGAVTIEASIDGTPIEVGADGTAVVTAPETPGNHTVEVEVSDGHDTITVIETFIVLDPDSATPPRVELHTPDYEEVLTAPTAIVASIADDDLVAWKLAYRDRNDRDADFVTLAEGSEAFDNAVIATFDPTLLLNGQYVIALQAWDAGGNTAFDSRVVTVDGEMKLGHFAISFEEVSIPVAGIPVTVTRSYDTRRSHQSLDFGHGWTVDYNNVRIHESRTIGFGWTLHEIRQGFFSTWCVLPNGDPIVTVTLPDGKVERFRARANPECQFPTPQTDVSLRFEPLDGTHSRLQSFDYGTVRLYQGNLVDLGDPELRPIDPDGYRLTTEDGMVYDLNQHFGVRKVTEPNGHSLTYTRNGVVHSTGLAIDFVRDGAGRITELLLPDGEVISYTYSAQGDLEAVIDQGDEVTQFAYHPQRAHYLAEIIDPRGVRVSRQEYDDDGRLIAVIDADGNRIEFDRDIDGRTEIVRDRAGHTTVYVYDERGSVLAETNALGETTYRTYDEWGNELSRTDPLGHTIAWTRDARGNVLTETDPLGHVTTSTYNTRNQVLTHTDALGRVVMSNTYQTNTGNLMRTLDALGHETSFRYDQGVGSANTGELDAITDTNGHSTHFHWSFQGRKMAETDALGHRTYFAYDAMNRVTRETRTRTLADGSPETLITRYTYDAKGRLTATEHPDGSVTTAEYDGLDAPVRECDALSRCTEHTYDPRGHKVRSVYPDGSEETWAYDPHGNLTAQTDRAGRTTRMVYDPLHRQVETIHPDDTPADDSDNPRTTNQYDEAGRLIAVTDENGHTTQYEYDAAGRRTAVIDALGHRTETQYDATGQRTAVIDAQGRITRFHYDATGRLTETEHPDGSTTRHEYDPVGRKTADIDEEGRRTEYGYDALGRLTEVRLPNPSTGQIDAGAMVTRYAYDEAGNRIEQTDAEGRSTRWTHDAMGRELTRTLPMGQTEHFAYDQAGQRTSHTDFNGVTTSYAYDAMGQVSAIAAPDRLVNLAYTPTGQRSQVSVTQSTGGLVIGTTHYAYDARDRLLEVTYPDGQPIAYAYDRAGNRTAVITAEQTVEYAFDPLNRLVDVTATPVGAASAATTTYAYHPVGTRASVTHANGLTTAYAYDSRNRLRSLVHRAAGVVLLGLAYNVDASGLRTGIEETHADGRTRVTAYQYDAVKRLTEEFVSDSVHGNRTSAWTYDKVGNRLTQTVVVGAASAATTSYLYDANDRLLEELADGQLTHYAYDPAGNLLARSDASGTATYTWDHDGRLLETTNSEASVRYAYDLDGIRQAQARTDTSGTTVTRYLIDPNHAYAQVIEEAEIQGATLATTATHVYGDDRISVTRQNEGTRHFHADGLGSTRLLTDAAGIVTDAYSYTAFGELDAAATAATGDNAFLYTGEQFDPNLGFYYLRARWMDVGIGRFLSIDPFPGMLGTPASLHKYLYASADPTNNLDPSGLVTMPQLISGLNSSLTATARNVGAAFKVSASAGGAALRSLGLAVEHAARQVIGTALRIDPMKIGGKVVNGPGGKRVIDFYIQIGQRIATIEAKYKIPRHGSQAFARLVAQLQSAMATPGTGQVVLWTLRGPTQAELRALTTTLGTEGSAVKVIHGLQALPTWSRHFFLGL